MFTDVSEVLPASIIIIALMMEATSTTRPYNPEGSNLQIKL
jgi:hypothetical protein